MSSEPKPTGGTRRGLLAALLGTSAAAIALAPSPAQASPDDDIIDGGTP
ncbi:hypothetical protein GHK92_19860 [Nocardioides sp. dk4132]|nr:MULTISPECIES: hypothetical protein [unclassified Nocardioides]MQW78128.1 hypothetical protein [Nocardioides sp. dk4132]